jgi:hypothetical protein
MTDEELISFGKDVRELAENPFQRQLEAARAEWRRRKLQAKAALAISALKGPWFEPG